MKSQKRHQGTWSKTGEHYVVMSSVSLVRVFSSVEDPKIQLDPFLPSISPSLHLRLRRWVCSLENDKKCLFDGNSLMRREYMECQLPHHFLMFHYYFAGVRSAWETVWVLFIALVTHFRPVFHNSKIEWRKNYEADASKRAERMHTIPMLKIFEYFQSLVNSHVLIHGDT